MIDTDTRDRVIALEIKVDNLTKAVETRDKKIDEIYEIVMQAKGARYVLAAAAALAGGIAGFLVKVIPFFPK